MGFGGKLYQLIGIIYNKVADVLLHTVTDIVIGLAVTVEENLLCREADAQCGVDFTG